MEELLDSHQGVVHKMKTLQEKARTINESLQEKARALDEATAAIDELDAKADRASRALEQEKRAHSATKLERDELAATLEASRADYENEILELKEQAQLASMRSGGQEGGDASAEAVVLTRKLEEKERAFREAQGRLREAETKIREQTAELNAAEERASQLRSAADSASSRGGDALALREQVRKSKLFE
jgi:uncharacterized coiled-coil DUF342 family protein